MTAETLQTLSQVFVFVGAGVAGIAGVGVWYFGKLANKQKDEATTTKQARLNDNIDELLSRAEAAESKHREISDRLKPFELLAQRKYPDTPDALNRLKDDLTKIDKRTEALESAQRPRANNPAVLSKQLAAYAGTRARVAYWQGDPEVVELASRLLAGFSAAGWDSKPHKWMSGGTSGLQGLAIKAVQGNEAVGQALQEALEQGGLGAVQLMSVQELGDIYGDAQLILLVGSKPLVQR